MQEEFDLVVIGAGPGGYVAAIHAAKLGMRVAVAEEREVGGTCLNRGCIPTKTLMYATHIYREMTMCEKLGIFAENLSYDIEKLYARKDEVVLQLRAGIEFLFKTNKITLLSGKAVLEGSGTVSVNTADGLLELKAKNILIAAGSLPVSLPIEGAQLPGVITSDGILEQSGTAYKSLTIIGGGVIGVELATVFSSLGCRVSMIEAMDRILPTMDREIAQNLNMILKKRGINIYTTSAVEQIVQGENGLICHFRQKGKEQTAEAEAVLVAVGRRANVEGIFGDSISIECNRGIVVDEHFQTSLPGVYAIGDVIHGGIQLAHAASAQGICAVAHMAGKTPEINLDVIPSCVYTDPEIASVGLTADEAKKQGMAVKTGKYSMLGNGKSVIEMQERGFVKLVFDAQSEVLLGAQLMCARATDMISELSTAVANKLTIHQLGSVVRPHPTFTEGITEAIEAVKEKN